MNSRIDCFLPYENSTTSENTLNTLLACSHVRKIYLLGTSKEKKELTERCAGLPLTALFCSQTMEKIVSRSEVGDSLLMTGTASLSLGYFAIERMLRVIHDSRAAMVYSDRYTLLEGVRSLCPVTDYQTGSLRDDFDFGSLLLFRSELLRQFGPSKRYRYAGLYDLR